MCRNIVVSVLQQIVNQPSLVDVEHSLGTVLYFVLEAVARRVKAARTESATCQV